MSRGQQSRSPALRRSKSRGRNDFERTVELGYLVDRLANFCGPNLAVLYELASLEKQWALLDQYGDHQQAAGVGR